MAGEIEELVGLDSKADSLHSGSISFGRFETEVLCWERRSAFLHNSYLEEVEKCSKPGSVTEKKAYFEAQFRKKGIKCLSLPGNQNGTEEINQLNTHTDSHHFDDSRDGSVSGRENEVVETEEEVFGMPFSESQSQLSFDSGKNDCTEVHLDKLESFIIANHVSNEPVGVSRDSNETKKSNNRSPLETVHMNPRMRPRIDVSQSRRSMSNKASKGSYKMPRNSESPVQGKCPTNRTSKYELGSKANGVNEKKRGEKDPIKKRIGEPRSSTLQKPSSRLRQSADRVKPVASTTKPCKNLDKSMLSFQCNNLAERRKEVAMKMRAKEAEMRQVRAKIDAEKKEAEIKQLRKSLTFKARSLPSFYYGALRVSDRNKKDASNDTVFSKYSNAVSRTANISRIRSETHKNQSGLSGAPQKTRSSADNTSGSTSCSSTVTSDRSPSSPDAVIRLTPPSKAVCGEKEKDRNNHTNLNKGIRRPTRDKSVTS